MKIRHLYWSTATITYDKPVPNRNGGKGVKSEVLTDVFVEFDGTGLKLSTSSPTNDRFLLLTRPTLQKMTPWGMEWTAFWWSASFGGKRYKKLVKATIVVEF